MGVTESVIKEVIEDEDANPVTSLYSNIQTMKQFRLSPVDWENLHRWDKMLLKYYSIMEMYLEKQSMEKHQRKEETRLKRLENAPPVRRG